MTSAATCPTCCGRGLIQIGEGVQYCMCVVGRERKRQWLSYPEEERLEFEIGPRLVLEARNSSNPTYSVDQPVHTVADEEDLFGGAGAGGPDLRLLTEFGREQLRYERCLAMLASGELSAGQRRALEEFAEKTERRLRSCARQRRQQ